VRPFIQDFPVCISKDMDYQDASLRLEDCFPSKTQRRALE
jgi:hypothetical protein